MRVAPLIRDVLAIGAAVLVVGVSFGTIAVAAGLPAWLPVVMSLFVFAGGAQFAAVAVVASGGGAAAAVAAGLLLNIRLLPLGFAVAEHLGKGLNRYLGTHLIADESVAFTVAQTEPHRRRAAFWATGVVLFVSWNLGVLIGVMAGRAIGDPERLGLDAAFPAALIALLVPALRRRRVRRVAAAAVAVALVAALFLPVAVAVLLALMTLPVALLPEGKTAP